MRNTEVEVNNAAGRRLALPAVRADGHRLLPRGRCLGTEELQILSSARVGHVTVIELEPDDVSADEAAVMLAPLVIAGPFDVTVGNGMVDFLSLQPSALIHHATPLSVLNSSGVAVVIPLRNFTHVPASSVVVASLRMRPIAIPRAEIEAVASLLRSNGPCLELRPQREARVTILYTDPVNPEWARQQFHAVAHERMEQFGLGHVYMESLCVEMDGPLALHLQTLFRRNLDLLMIVSSTPPTGPDDEIFRALCDAGAQIESRLAPVEPGSHLMLAYYGKCAIVSAPGCFCSHQCNVLDMVLPPLLTGYRLDAMAIAGLACEGVLGPMVHS